MRFPSASGTGRRRRIPFELDHGRHLGGATHFHLLNHPAVYEQIRAWLAGAPGQPAVDAGPPGGGPQAGATA